MRTCRHHKRSTRRKGIWRIVDPVVDGLSRALGLSHGIIIAGFVCGFIFVPLLTAMVFLVTLYWVSYPDQARKQLACVSSYVRGVLRRIKRATDAMDKRNRTAKSTSDGDPRTANRPPLSRAQLRARFEALDKRANAIEAFVASEEYLLEREFKRMRDNEV